MNFIDNWIYQLDDVLASGGAVLPVSDDAIGRLGLADGVTYTLVLSGTLAQAGGGAFEIVHLHGAEDGSYTLVRGQEGTDDVEWPAGTLVMATVTAAQLAGFGGGADSGWLTLEALGGFADPPQARRIDKVVYMRGSMDIPQAYWSQPIAQLPPGWAPGLDLLIFQSDSVSDQNFTVGADGVITVGGPYFPDPVPDVGYLNFDGVTFPVG